MEFKYNMSLAELRKRTSKTYYRKLEFLSPESREVKKLSARDKLVLLHLVKAAKIVDKIQLQLENVHNLELLEFLNKEIKDGNEKAERTKKMFMSQKSIFSPDTLGNQTVLVKGVERKLGQNYFPEDLEVEEFHEILNRMLDDGDEEELKKILNQRTIVRRDGDKLKAIDFVDAFPEFREVAKELELAKEYSTDKKFNKYLELQIKALEQADPMLDAKADKVWAELDGRHKFEFTLTRECYQENLTKTIFDNEQLAKRLKDAGVTVYAKDSLGVRVGLVNKKGTKLLNKLKELVNVSAKYMPYQNEYENKKSDSDVKQIAVDVDLITVTGDEGAYKASFVTAQNLPNSDKLAFSIGGGNRNVYHRQVRKPGKKKNYRKLLCEEQWEFYNPEADHWAVICHENTHSLGPQSKTLGKYSSILEEYKADMGMYAFLDEFIQEGFFTEFETKQIMVTGLFRCFMKGKPTLEQAHKTRALMICCRMIEEGGIVLDKDTKIHFDFDKIKKLTKTMLAEVVRLQLDGDVKKAKAYIDKWCVWSNEIERIAEVIRGYNKTLNGYVEEKFADLLLEEGYEKQLLEELKKETN